MNWKQIWRDIRGVRDADVWKAAHRLARTLRLQRTEMRVFMLCHFTHRGPAALNGLDVLEILTVRAICGRNWFDLQLKLSDEGHTITDPFRTLV